MHKISLKDWVVLLTIVPTTVIGLSIASYFSYSRYVELNDNLALRAQSIIEPIAIASVEPVKQKERFRLRQLIGLAHKNHSGIVKNIAVLAKDNQVIVSSSLRGDTNMMRLGPSEPIPNKTVSLDIDNYAVFRTPIIDDSASSNFLNIDDRKIGYIAIQIDKSKVQFNQQSQVLIAFSVVLFGSLISSIFAFRLIKNVTRPVSSMVNAVDRIREGKLESRVSGKLIGELNFLKNGINAMAQSLGDYHDEMHRSIDQATVDLRESLEQFEIQNVELDLAKRKAQEANKVKSEFLANMSHELRTPLNGVLGFTRQVLKTPLTETQRDYLQTIERSANNLLAIINDVLDFSKLDAGKMVIENVPFALRETVEETLTLLAPSAHKKNIELSLRVNQQIPESLIGDAMRIKQVMINLANNAIKFTEKGSVCIDIDCTKSDDSRAEFKITVTDTGIGMTVEQQKTIFDAFGQADKSVTRLYGGTGLGLVISQRLSREMGGDVGFISEENRGSTFWFTFQCELNKMHIGEQSISEELNGKRILYFEPHTHGRIATSETMAAWNMQVMPVDSLDELSTALESDTHFDYALIAHDVTPSALAGLKELIHYVKAKIPTIHLAINSNSPSLQEALVAVGASSCLSKPLTPERLHRALLPQQHLVSDTALLLQHYKAPLKVLAVDDNEANLKLIKALLSEQVKEVTIASNGKEAVELCKNEKFALIFMDIQMPIMDGVTALKHIQSNTFNDDTPIIAVTAHALSGEKEKLIEQGFNAYMTKPIDESMLRHTIYEYCDTELLQAQKEEPLAGLDQSFFDFSTKEINWQLALERAGNKPELAKDLLSGLVNSLPETKEHINDAITCQDVEQVKVLIHKLNGACCYTGVPLLGKITHQIETDLKRGKSLEDIEPELFEFFEHIDNIVSQTPQVLIEIEDAVS